VPVAPAHARAVRNSTFATTCSSVRRVALRRCGSAAASEADTQRNERTDEDPARETLVALLQLRSDLQRVDQKLGVLPVERRHDHLDSLCEGIAVGGGKPSPKPERLELGVGKQFARELVGRLPLIVGRCDRHHPVRKDVVVPERRPLPQHAAVQVVGETLLMRVVHRNNRSNRARDSRHREKSVPNRFVSHGRHMGRSGEKRSPARRHAVAPRPSNAVAAASGAAALRLTEAECARALEVADEFIRRYHEAQHGRSGYALPLCPLGLCANLAVGRLLFENTLRRARDREDALISDVRARGIAVPAWVDPDRESPGRDFLPAAEHFRKAARQLFLEGHGRSDDLDGALIEIERELKRASATTIALVGALSAQQ
jgi:hypothetical protein